MHQFVNILVFFYVYYSNQYIKKGNTLFKVFPLFLKLQAGEVGGHAVDKEGHEGD